MNIEYRSKSLTPPAQAMFTSAFGYSIFIIRYSLAIRALVSWWQRLKIQNGVLE